MRAVAVLVWYHRWGWSFFFFFPHPLGCSGGGPCCGDYARTCYLACLLATCQSTRHSPTTSRQAAALLGTVRSVSHSAALWVAGVSLVGASPSSDPRIFGTAFSFLSPLPVVRCTFLSPRSLSLPLERGQEEDKSDAACACVCKCPRVCLFCPFALIPGFGQPVARDGRLYLGEENCLPIALPLSLLRTKKKKSGQAFIYCFACFLIAILQLPFKVEMETFFQCFLSPERSHLFFGQVVLLCKESDCWPSFMMHSGG